MRGVDFGTGKGGAIGCPSGFECRNDALGFGAIAAERLRRADQVDRGILDRAAGKERRAHQAASR